MWFKRIILVSLVVLFASSLWAAERVDLTSNKDFNKTVTSAVKSIKSRGMMVVATIDHKKMLSMVGAKIGGSKTIEFGKPDMGKMIFAMAIEAGLEMPAKIYIFEKDGKTLVSYYKSNYASYNPEFSKVDEMMNMMLSEIVKDATK